MGKFRIGVKYGIVKALIKEVSTKEERVERDKVLEDLKHADEELLDCLGVGQAKSLKEIKTIIDNWLELEAKMTGYDVVEYIAGEGKNLFKKIGIERELFYRGLDRKDENKQG